MATMHGTIKRLVSDKGFGFVKADDGMEYFFHQASVVDGNFDDLREGMRVGFDPTKPSEGAGNLLYTKIVQSSYSLGDKQYELGIGSMEAKRHLTTNVETNYRFTHFPLSLRAQALRAKRAVKTWLQTRQAAQASEETPIEKQPA